MFGFINIFCFYFYKIVRRYLDLFSGDGHFYVNGRDTLSDVTGTHGLTLPMYTRGYQPANIREGIINRTAKKIAKYDVVVSRLGFNFRPLAFEIHGGALSAELDLFITQRTSSIAERLGRKPSTVKNSWLKRLSCIIRKHEASIVLNRVDRVLNRNLPLSHQQDIFGRLDQPVVVDRFVVSVDN